MELGDIFVHAVGGPERVHSTVVAVTDEGGDTKFLEGYNIQEVLDLLENSDIVYHVKGLYYEGLFDEEYNGEDDEEFGNLVPAAEYEKRKQISDKVIAVLVSEGIETNDLIVSDGVAYIGYEQCAEFIEQTHTWCSSSMSC